MKCTLFALIVSFIIFSFWNDHVMSTYIRKNRAPWQEIQGKDGCPDSELDDAGICVMDCFSDSDCQENHRCCSNGCGYGCVYSTVKPGSCPEVFSQSCNTNCQSDLECHGSDKCCNIGCGSVCLDAIPES